MDEILAAIDAALKEKPELTDASLSMKAVGNKAFLKNLRNSKAVKEGGGTVDSLMAIAQTLGLEFYFGEPRQPFLKFDQVAPDTEFARVDRYLVDLSAGNGSLNDNVEKSAPVAFRADWMRDNGIKPENCVVATVKGDSMSPTLKDRDLVLLDRTTRDVVDGTIYALVDTMGDVRVKRLERVAGNLIVRSDNPVYPLQMFAAEDANTLTIIGRVIWSGRTF